MSQTDGRSAHNSLQPYSPSVVTTITWRPGTTPTPTLQVVGNLGGHRGGRSQPGLSHQNNIRPNIPTQPAPPTSARSSHARPRQYPEHHTDYRVDGAGPACQRTNTGQLRRGPTTRTPPFRTSTDTTQTISSRHRDEVKGGVQCLDVDSTSVLPSPKPCYRLRACSPSLFRLSLVFSPLPL